MTSQYKISPMDNIPSSRVLTSEEEHVVMRKFDIARHRWVGAVVGLAASLPLATMGSIFGKHLVVGRKSRPGSDASTEITIRAIRERMAHEGPAKRRSSVLKCVRLVKERTFDSESITALEREVEKAVGLEKVGGMEGDTDTDTSCQLGWYVKELETSAEAYRALLSTILECNLKLVAKMASAFQRRKDFDSMMDFFQAGSMGLLIAIDRFDYRRNLKLSTYASHWIRQAMQRRTIDYSQPTRKPSYRQDADRMIRRELINLESEEWRYFSQSDRLDEAARRAGLLSEENSQGDSESSRGHYIDAMSRVNSEMSDGYINRWCREVGLDDDFSADSGRRIAPNRRLESGEMKLDAIDHLSAGEMPREMSQPDTQAQDADANLLTRRVDEVLNTLTTRESKVVRWRFGLNREGAEDGPLPGHVFTLSQVGDALGLTRERVRQVQAQALSKLQESGRASHLSGFI